jgi:hypothetical protein
MLNFGAVDSHANKLAWADHANYDGFTSFSACIFLIENADTAGQVSILSKDNGDGANFGGWNWNLNNENMVWTQGNGAGARVDVLPGISIKAVGALDCWGVYWSGTNIQAYQDGAAIGANPALTEAMAATTATLILGDGATFTGHAGTYGQPMVWKNKDITAAGFLQYFNGAGPPEPADLVFWTRGIVEPSLDSVTSASPTETGTVTLTANGVDAYFSGGGSFAMFVAQVLLPIWGKFLIDRAELLGPGSFREYVKMMHLLAHRCGGFDWRGWELKEFVRSVQSRPLIFDYGML